MMAAIMQIADNAKYPLTPSFNSLRTKSLEGDISVHTSFP